MQNIERLKEKYQELGEEIEALEEANKQLPKLPSKLTLLVWTSTWLGCRPVWFVIGNWRQVLYYDYDNNNYSVCWTSWSSYGFSHRISNLREVSISNLYPWDIFLVTNFKNINECDLTDRMYYMKIDRWYVSVSYDDLSIRHLTDSRVREIATGSYVYKII